MVVATEIVGMEYSTQFGQPLRNPFRGHQIQLKGMQVAIVDPNHGRIGTDGQRHVQFLIGMNFNQRDDVMHLYTIVIQFVK